VGKADAKDALVVAEQAHMRRDFTPVETPPKRVAMLQLPTGYRADLIAGRVWLINRLCDLPVGICRPWNGPSTARQRRER
jgi:hypothetical protein